MTRERLDVLFVSQWPPSPAAFGAQRRVEGLMSGLAARHRVSVVCLVGHGQDASVARQAIRAYADEVVVVPAGAERGMGKRLLQLRSLASTTSFERAQVALPALRHALDNLLRRRRFDVVSVEAPHLMQHRVRQAPPGDPPPRVVLDEHNIEFDLARQSRDASERLPRRVYHTFNWRKVRREEVAAWRTADGVAFTSEDDAARARAVYPAVNAAVVPNAVDVERFRPRPDLPPTDGRTVVFFGTMNYFPNQDSMLFFLRDVWPRIERAAPRARLKIVGPHPTPEVLAHRGPRVEVTGLVDDVLPHLSSAACVIAPLRVGGGTRFKILEAMAMAKPIVSTTLGAEGIAAIPERDLVIADGAEAFAAAVVRVLDEPDRARLIGARSRELVEARYSWRAVTLGLEEFMRGLVEPRSAVRLGEYGHA